VHPSLPPPPGNGVSTREIPVVPPTGPTTSPQPSAAAVAAAQPQPTGPVDYVPGPPAAGAAPLPPPVGATAPTANFFSHPLDHDEPRRPRDRQTRARLTGGALAAAGLVLLELGLLLHDEGGERLWSRVPLWAGFATVAAVLGLGVLGARLPGPRQLGARAWAVAAGGLAGLAVFWLLVVLPSAATDRGFLLTAALACLAAAVRLTAARGIPAERTLDRTGALGTTDEAAQDD
jgi:hypothetical protein